MALSVVQICNNALIKVGANLISSLTEDSRQAQLVNQLYPILRDDLLRMHPWNFAMTRVTLASDVASPDFEFTYQYTLPSDCLRVHKLYKHNGRFKIEGRKILSDDDDVELIYLKQVTDVGKFPSDFADVLATRLAAEIAYAVTGSNSFARGLMEAYDRKFKHAKMSDAQENYNENITADHWIDSRLVGADVVLHDKPD